MGRFPISLEERFNVSLDVFKHIPSAVLMKSLSLGADYHQKYTRELNNLLRGLSQSDINSRSYTRLLSDAGFTTLARVYIPDGELPSYRATWAGDRYGRDLADFVISYSLGHSPTLIESLGSAITIHDRTSGRRARILYTLLNAKEIDKRESMRKTHLVYEIESHIDNDLEDLEDAGFINSSESEVFEQPVKELKFKGNKNQLIHVSDNARKIAFSIIRGNLNLFNLRRDTHISIYEIYDSLDELNNKKLISCDRTINTKRIDISITKEGIYFINNFLLPFEDILNGNKEGIEIRSFSNFFQAAEESLIKYVQAMKRMKERRMIKV